MEVAANAAPPVCRIMDYGKFRFEQQKKQQEARKNQKRIQIKEIKFRPGTDEGDYQVKLRNLNRFLADGDKAKVTVRFRGREMAHQGLGQELLTRIEADLAEVGVVEQKAGMEGRQMVMVFAPKKITCQSCRSIAAETETNNASFIMPKMKTHRGAAKRFKKNGERLQAFALPRPTHSHQKVHQA